MQLTWKASESASAMHAVHALAEGRALVAPGAADALGPLVATPPPAARGDLPRLTRVLLEQAAAGIERNTPLAERALAKLHGRDRATETETSSLSAWIASVERAYFDWHRSTSGRQLVDEIVTRTAPIHDLWDARGPGLLREIGRRTEPDLLAARADVVMVLPVLAGGGAAHLPTNTVTLEAVLTNTDPSLPEVVRLAWLLSQLQFDLPATAEQLSPGGAAAMAPLAMLAPALTSAEDLELAEFSPASLAHAAVLWRIASSPAEADRLAGIVAQWWETYERDRPRWVVAARALEQMLNA